MSNSINRFAATGALLAAFSAPPAHAALGDTLVASGGHVVLRFEGTAATYVSLISVNGSVPAFASDSTAAGTTLDLGSFAAGTQLDFALLVVTTGDTFYSGAGAANSDGLAHANVIYNYLEAGRTWVGFEDVKGGGDLDYNDYKLSFTNVQTPVPELGTFALMLAGLLGAGTVSRRLKGTRA